MFNFFKRKGNRVEMTLKTFEVWVKETEVGMFIRQEKTRCIDSVVAYSQEEADALAKAMGGYAVATMK